MSISQPNVQDCVTAIESTFQQENMKVFPNPTKGLFTVSVGKIESPEKVKIVILTMNGQVVLKEKVTLTGLKFEKQIDLSGYPSGMYLLQITSKNKYYKAQVILK